MQWRDTGETTEEFWLHVAAFEAVSCLEANRSAQLFEAEAIRAIERATRPLPCGAWAWPGTHQVLRYRDSSVVMICTDGPDYWVVAAAPTETELDWLDQFALEWDEEDSRR